jgi:hypothetical protein
MERDVVLAERLREKDAGTEESSEASSEENPTSETTTETPLEENSVQPPPQSLSTDNKQSSQLRDSGTTPATTAEEESATKGVKSGGEKPQVPEVANVKTAQVEDSPQTLNKSVKKWTMELRKKKLPKKGREKNIKALVRSSMIFPGKVAASESVDISKLDETGQKKRYQIMYEIFQTECNYVRNLKILVRVRLSFTLGFFFFFSICLTPSFSLCTQKAFINPLIREKYIKKSEYDAIFCNIDSILKNHRKFLRNMESRITEWSPDKQFADVFLKEVNETAKRTSSFSFLFSPKN